MSQSPESPGRPFVGAMSLLLTAVVALASPTPAGAGDRPNIVFIYLDDHAAHAISAYGSNRNHTPHIDRIADEGMRFDRCYVTNSLCGPARAVVLTGKYSHINGFRRNGDRFDGGQWSFNKDLQAAGYQTAIIGKWHLGTDPQGFDHWDILPGQGHYYNPTFLTEGQPRQRDVEGYVTDIITDLSLEWLDQRDPERPFLLMLQHKAPHREWEPGPDHLTLYQDVDLPEPDNLFDDYEGRGSAARDQEMTIARHLRLGPDLKVWEAVENPEDNQTWRRTYGRMNEEQRADWDAAYGPENRAFLEAGLEGGELVRWMYQRYMKDYLRTIASVDDNVGRVLDYLDEHGLADNTVVIYTSDQGFFLGEHGWYDKRFMYEESYRTPFIVRWPGVVPAGSVNDAHLVSNVDFAPTFMSMAGLPTPADVQGLDMTPLLEGREPEQWRTSHYYHYYEFPAVHMVQRHEGVSDGRYKLIKFYDIGEWEFYDLENDPHEMRSQYANPEYAPQVERMKGELERLREELQLPDEYDPLPER